MTDFDTKEALIDGEKIPEPRAIQNYSGKLMV